MEGNWVAGAVRCPMPPGKARGCGAGKAASPARGSRGGLTCESRRPCPGICRTALPGAAASPCGAAALPFGPPPRAGPVLGELANSSCAFSPLRLGVNAMLRKVAVAAASKPHVEIRQDGDQFYIKTSTTVRTTEINFKIGESFEEETVDGRKCRVRRELCVRYLCVCVCVCER